MDSVRPQQFDFSIVSPELTVEAMRDSGYRDTDHALAELIDNSIDADANIVELIAIETPPDPMVRYSRATISQIAVADDGTGMDYITLRRALKYGDGSRLDRKAGRIGRFGVGLPNASMSQCARVDIWSWEHGIDNALHCYLDLGEMRQGRREVPEPQHDPVPDRWRPIVRSTIEQSGTLVVWSQLDRVRWRGGAKTLDRTAELCGRIYRKFLTDESRPVEILLALVEDDGSQLVPQRAPFRCLPNDPLYLMTESSTPPPFHDEPMFRRFNERTWMVPVGRLEGSIHARCTLARPDAINEKRSQIPWPRSYSKAGDAPWGKHAHRNKGVSIVRAQRELELSLAWVNNYEPEERWWSVEVEFDPILDEIFGVTNNKQHAHDFVAGAGFDWKEAAYEDESYGTFKERLRDTADPRGHLVEVWEWIDDQIRQMREERKRMMTGTGTPRSRHPETGEEVEDVATNVIREQAQQDIVGTSDEAPETTPEQKISQLVESAKKRRVDSALALEWARETVEQGRRVRLKSVTLGHRNAFFEVSSVNDVIEVWLNDGHPVYQHLIEAISDFEGDESLADLTSRLEKASFTLKMILIAWARHEDKVGSVQKEHLQDVRTDWGREARIFLGPIEQ